jgi:hypothetical protein
VVEKLSDAQNNSALRVGWFFCCFVGLLQQTRGWGWIVGYNHLSSTSISGAFSCVTQYPDTQLPATKFSRDTLSGWATATVVEQQLSPPMTGSLSSDGRLSHWCNSVLGSCHTGRTRTIHWCPSHSLAKRLGRTRYLWRQRHFFFMRKPTIESNWVPFASRHCWLLLTRSQ